MLLGPRGPVGPGSGWLERRLPLPGPRRRLRAWRRTRPFWGGLLVILGGTELLLVPLSPLTVLVSLGLGGIAAIGIGIALIAAGAFLWLLPQARAYVSIHALLLSVLSFVATNLGGFLLGMLLGIAGSALAFGWTPLPDPEAAEEGAPYLPSLDGSGPRTLAAALPVVLLASLVAGAGAPRAEAAGTAREAPAARAARAAPEAPASPEAPAAPAAPTAARTPPTVTTSLFAPQGFTFAGVTHVPTADGPLKVLVLRMRAATLTDYRLRTRDGRDEYGLAARRLDLRGDVTLYLTRFSGCIEGLLCVTFSPDGLPAPPVIPPFVFMTRVSAEQALVTSDVIETDDLRLEAS
ncbi:DUF6114 domain-containing protein [Streptomyces sp. 4.24]|uniref:DUF6114 domain-containing protein n=1 Tax=Streptomyces tritrimontium TaxID=3406573 RepID=UPI003BB714E9